MTLEQAYEITSKMTISEHENPTDLQREAKDLIFETVLYPRFSNKDGSISPMLEPDFLEGWH